MRANERMLCEELLISTCNSTIIRLNQIPKMLQSYEDGDELHNIVSENVINIAELKVLNFNHPVFRSLDMYMKYWGL